ncbi:hypothetical protein ACFVRU_01435 [Streptomyces sp. NPDC057927]
MASRDERIENYYQESARELAESLVDAEDEVTKLRSAWRAATATIESWRRMFRRESDLTRDLLSFLVQRGSEAGRYRSAWLSARRRAADEANFGMEAMERERARQASYVAELRRHRAFADEVKQVHYRCRDGEPDCAERFLRAIYDSMYELWEADREKRQFVDRVHRRAARGEFDDVAEDEPRETTDAPRLECVGTEEDGATVWRLANGSRIR